MSELNRTSDEGDAAAAAAAAAWGAAAGAEPAAEAAPRHDLEVLNTIHRISDSSGLSLHERLSAIVKVVAFHLRSDACSIYLEAEDLGGRLVLAATHGLNADAVGRVTLGAGEGAGAIVKDEERCIRCGLCAERCPTGAITMEALELDQSPQTALGLFHESMNEGPR